MNKLYKISNSQLQTAHNTISGDARTQQGLIFTTDTRKVYYQDSDYTKSPQLISYADQWVALDTASQKTLSSNVNYVRTAAATPLYIPVDASKEYGLAAGDTIHIYNMDNSEFYIKLNNTAKTTVMRVSANFGGHIVCYYDGSDWHAYNQEQSVVSQLSAISSWVGNIISGSPSEGAKLQDGVLPYANSNGNYGIVTICPYTEDSQLTHTMDPVAGSAMIQVMSGIVTGIVSSYIMSGNITGNTSATNIKVNKLPSAGVNGQVGVTTINGNSTSATISASPYPMAASAVYNFVSGINITNKLSGRLSGVRINGVEYKSTTTYPNVADLGLNWANVTGTTAGEYVIKTETGYTTTPGIATLSSTYTAANVVNYPTGTPAQSALVVDGNAIPLMLKSNHGAIYPIEKGTMSTGISTYPGKFLIDPRPYIAYEVAAGLQDNNSLGGTWTVYYGAGINDLYTTANRVQTDSTTASSYNALFGTADAFVITLGGTGTFTLTVPAYNASTNTQGLPIGHGMIFKIINPNGRTVTFGTSNNIITAAGTYTFSVFNFTGAVEQVGSVAKVKDGLG